MKIAIVGNINIVLHSTEERKERNNLRDIFLTSMGMESYKNI